MEHKEHTSSAGDRGLGKKVIRGIDVEVSGTVRIIDKDGNVKSEQEIISLDNEETNNAT